MVCEFVLIKLTRTWLFCFQMCEGPGVSFLLSLRASASSSWVYLFLLTALYGDSLRWPGLTVCWCVDIKFWRKTFVFASKTQVETGAARLALVGFGGDSPLEKNRKEQNIILLSLHVATNEF